MAIYGQIQRINTYVTGVQIYGEVIIAIYDATSGLPTNGNNCVVNYTQNINGASSSGTVTISGLYAIIYSGELDATDLSFYTSFFIDSLTPGGGIPPDPAADDLKILNILTTPESAIGANDGTITINATSSFPAIQYSLDNSTWQNSNVFTGLISGPGTAYVKDTNSGLVSQAYTVGLLGNILVSDPTVDLGNGNLSRWNAAFNPIWFKYQRKDYEITSIIEATDGSGNILVAVNADMSNVTARTTITTANPLHPTVTSPGDFVYINTAKYQGAYEVLTANAGSLILDLPYTATDTTGFININSLRPYYRIQTVITYVDVDANKFVSITSNNTPNLTGYCEVDLSSFLKSLVKAKDKSGYNKVNYRDAQLSASYTIKYAEIWAGNIPQWATITRPYYVVYAAKQIQQIGGGNLQQFVPYPLGFQPALWVTDFKMPVYNPAFPFDIGFIYSEYMVNLNSYYVVVLLDINMQPLASQVINNSFLLNTDGSFILQQDGSKFIIASQQISNVPIVQQVGLNRLLLNFTPPDICYYFSVQLKYDANTAPATFGYSLSEVTSPDFVDGNASMAVNGVDVVNVVFSPASGSVNVGAGSPYSILAYSGEVSTAPNPRLRLTVKRNGTTIFDQSVVQSPTATIAYSGIAQPGAAYTWAVVTDDNAYQVTPINIPDNTPVVVVTCPLTVAQNIKVSRETPDRQVYLRWIGLTGSWNYFTFVYNQAITLDVTNEVLIKNYVTDWANEDTITDVVSKNAGNKMTVFAENLTVDEIKGLQAIKYSPKVQLYIGPIVSGQQWQTVDTGSGSYQEYETYVDQYSFSLAFKLPEINIQYQ